MTPQQRHHAKQVSDGNMRLGTIWLDPPAAAALSALRERTGQSAQACVRAALGHARSFPMEKIVSLINEAQAEGYRLAQEDAADERSGDVIVRL